VNSSGNEVPDVAHEPFDPKRISVPPEERPAAVAPDHPLTVSQLTRLIKRAITEHLPSGVRVMGEISNLSRPSSGHLYFTLKDAGSELPCVMWRSASQRLRFRPQDGMAVIATGEVDVYEPRGAYQLYVRKLEPQGVGELELAFRQLREKLQREGLFDPDHKKPLPPYPERIAVVTSPSGAALRDIVQTIRRRFPCVEILLMPVRVQGEGAAEDVVAAIGSLNRQAGQLGGIDVMIVGRGGGSLEDLWAFNEEMVARAIYASRIPIISAVGHEIDITISDLVADVRAATPTAAAELVVPSRSEVVEQIEMIAGRFRRIVGHRMDIARSDLIGLERFELFRRPMAAVDRSRQQVDELAARLSLNMTRCLRQTSQNLHRCEVALGAIHPRGVLQQRYRQLTEVEHHLRWSQGGRNLKAERQLMQLLQSLSAVSPHHSIVRHRDTLQHLADRLHRAMAERQAQVRRDLEHTEQRLRASSHEAVLRRGFSITRLARGGQIITHPSQVHEGSRISTETRDGRFESRVIDAKQLDLFE